MVIETERLLLRELNFNDANPLFMVLGDKESMKFYPSPYTFEKVVKWIEWNIDNYSRFGFGLYAVTLKEDGTFIGDCGITMQNIGGERVPEIGFHINKNYVNKGYATEAAMAFRDYGFEAFHFESIYCYQKSTNAPSRKVAEKIGMRLVEEYPDDINGTTSVYRITRSTWQKQKNEKASYAIV